MVTSTAPLVRQDKEGLALVGSGVGAAGAGSVRGRSSWCWPSSRVGVFGARCEAVSPPERPACSSADLGLLLLRGLFCFWCAGFGADVLWVFFVLSTKRGLLTRTLGLDVLPQGVSRGMDVGSWVGVCAHARVDHAWGSWYVHKRHIYACVSVFMLAYVNKVCVCLCRGYLPAYGSYVRLCEGVLWCLEV